MIRLAGFLVLAAALALFTGLNAEGQDKDKEVTLKGKVTCAKCDLKVKEFVDAKKCATVIVVKDGDKDVVYYFDAAAHKKNHSTVCSDPTNGTVSGVASKKDDKNFITVKTIELAK